MAQRKRTTKSAEQDEWNTPLAEQPSFTTPTTTGMTIDQADAQAEAEEFEFQEQEVEPKPKPKKKTDAALPTVFTAASDTYLKADTLEGRYRLAKAFIAGGMVPKGYRTPEQVFAGLEYARELQLKPLVGLRNIAVINGSPSIWGDAPLALVRRSKQLEYIQEFLFDKDFEKICFANKNINAEAYGAVCITKRKEDPEAKETWFTMDDAKRAGLLGRDNVWKTYPRRMLQMRARSQNLKDNFSDCLMGIEIAEYDYNYIPQAGLQERTINRRGEQVIDVAKTMNEKLMEGDNE